MESYNAYKHGLRMNMGTFSMLLAQPENLPAGWVEAIRSPDSSQYFVKKRGKTDPAIPKDHMHYLLETHGFAPEASSILIRLLRTVMRNIVITRLDVLYKRPCLGLKGFPDQELDLVMKSRGQFNRMTYAPEGPLSEDEALF